MIGASAGVILPSLLVSANAGLFGPNMCVGVMATANALRAKREQSRDRTTGVSFFTSRPHISTGGWTIRAMANDTRFAVAISRGSSSRAMHPAVDGLASSI
jgi:hypothetical protein